MAVVQMRSFPSLLVVIIGLSHGYVEQYAVPGSLGEITDNNKRFRRQSQKQNTNKAGFTSEEKQNILQLHNKYRRIPDAADMLYMTWDSELEAKAQEWANKCKFSHNPDKVVPSSGTRAGENLQVGSMHYNEEDTVKQWYSEIDDYTYKDNSCAGTCGHYKQVVWAKTDKVGCGIKYCPTAEGLSFEDAYIVVCNYLVAGNMVGSKPYIQGEACSECPSGRGNCDDGLCGNISGANTTPGPATSTRGTGTPVTACAVLLLWSIIAYKLALL